MTQPRKPSPVAESTALVAPRAPRRVRTVAAALCAGVLLTVGAAACSSGDKKSDDTTTTTTAVSADSTATTATTLPEASAANVSTSLLWVRPSGGEPREIPGYTDPEGQDTPLLAYGSVTNNGTEPIEAPVASALWKNAEGATQLTTVATLSNPDGTPVTVIEPGESVDVWALVSGDTSEVFKDLTPEFVVAPAQ